MASSEIFNIKMEVEQSGSASDTDTSSGVSVTKSRLGICEVCSIEEAKYACPRCEVKTCCLKCLQIHKKELNCNGIRDRTKYIPLKKMTKLDFQSDYNFLEECKRFVEVRKQDKNKRFSRYNKNLPAKLFKLRNAARIRNCTLKFLLDNFSKRNSNSTYFDTNLGIIFWRIEWIFPNATSVKFADDKINENEMLAALGEKYINPDHESEQHELIKKHLEFYQSRGTNEIRFLLKAEGIKDCNHRFYELDLKKSLKQNLSNRIIVEYPEIYVVYREDLDTIYQIINDDLDVVAETKEYENSLNEIYKKLQKNESLSDSHLADEQVRENMERMKIAKKQHERRKRHAEDLKEPKNYLFADENMWDDLSSDTDGNMTEEEDNCFKRKPEFEME